MFLVYPTQYTALMVVAPVSETTSQILPWLAIPVFLGGCLLGAMLIIYWNRSIKKSATAEAARTKADAEKEIDKLKVEAKLRLTEESKRKQDVLEQERKEFKKEAKQEETRLRKKEDEIEQKFDVLNRSEKALMERDKKITQRLNKIDRAEEELREMIEKEKEVLLDVAKMSKDEAVNLLMSKLEEETKTEMASRLQKEQDYLKENIEKLSVDVLQNAIQRCAVSYTSDSLVATVDIPNDDMKGRIIGREGRNIRAIEKVTGVDIIVDDTPGVIVVSCFDNVRREIARRSLEKLILDGRIHPSRIEELVSQTKKEIEDDIRDTGKATLQELDIHNVNGRMTRLLGRLKYRTSYGQNVLKHSIEVAHLSASLAAELRISTKLAKRCGLFHDIGKALDHELEGGHPNIGADVARRCDERKEVINSIAAHHEDVNPESIFAVITQVADAISAARPGARRETMEKYIKRLERLEEVASGFDGVTQSFAIQAGREVRVIVNSDKVDDDNSLLICRKIAKKIEEELSYPGEVRVTLIRETRITEYAR
ncbi:MAG: ribonuclease Y [Planctomycetota bacterium]|jgi:ribonuclease Y